MILQVLLSPFKKFNAAIMKKKLLYLGAFLLIVSFASSCEKLKDNCKQCRYNTYVNLAFTSAELEAEYCGTDLITRQAAPDVTVGDSVTKFECD